METKKDDVIRSRADLEKALEGTGVKILGEIPRLDKELMPSVEPSYLEKLRIRYEAWKGRRR